MSVVSGVKLLNIEEKKSVDQSFSCFPGAYPEFCFNEEKSEAGLEPGVSFTMLTARNMAHEVVIDEPVHDVSHRKILGPWIVRAKALIRKVSRPFIKILFVRQQRMNELVLSLAYSVAALEDRIATLEKKHPDQSVDTGI